MSWQVLRAVTHRNRADQSDGEPGQSWLLPGDDGASVRVTGVVEGLTGRAVAEDDLLPVLVGLTGGALVEEQKLSLLLLTEKRRRGRTVPGTVPPHSPPAPRLV